MLRYNIVVSANKNDVIGIDNQLLIECKDDLRRFYDITTGTYPEGDYNICIMGYNTWMSIPEIVRPFKKRLNIIISSNHAIKESENCKVFITIGDAFEWSLLNAKGKIFVIGGEMLFNECVTNYKNNLDCIYLTRFQDYFDSERSRKLPKDIFLNKHLIYEEKPINSRCQIYGSELTEINHSFEIYQSDHFKNQSELQYLNLMNKILKENNLFQSRNGDVLNSFGERIIFDLKEGFPLLTTKRIGNKTILRELLWFIKGSTNNKELKEKNVHIWDQNASREFLDSRGLSYGEDDLGPIYGFQWRHFGAEYKDCHTNYEGLGVDQLKNVIHLIHTEPNSRRIIMSAWNPLDLDKMALPPCHVLCQFSVNQIQGTIDCQLYQRSGDMFLGVPFNIASYSFLLCIICHITKYNPGKLIHVLGDSHIYKDHINVVKEQIRRVPFNYPSLDISDELCSIDDIKEEYFTIKDYKYYPKLSAHMVA